MINASHSTPPWSPKSRPVTTCHSKSGIQKTAAPRTISFTARQAISLRKGELPFAICQLAAGGAMWKIRSAFPCVIFSISAAGSGAVCMKCAASIDS